MSDMAENVAQEIDYVALLEDKDLTTERFIELRKELFSSAKDRRRVKKFTAPHVDTGSESLTPKLAQHVGLCLAAIGEHQSAISYLAQGAKSAPTNLALAKCKLAVRQTKGAVVDLTALLKSQPGDLEVLRTLLDVYELRDDVKSIQGLLQSSSAALNNTPDLHYIQGLLAERARRHDEAMVEYQKALDLDENHSRSLFRLAYRCDMAGHDEQALDLYERCRELKPTFANVYLNLGVLYDDREEYQKSIECFQALLDLDPKNERARLFLKDAVASLDMYYDEDQERREDKLNQILKIPVTDFELSVRSRNCLERMKIRTLGDLIKKTEPELLSYKNFGETSLAEIKEILSSKNLKLGIGREELERTAVGPDNKIDKLKAMITGIGAPSDDTVSKPISDLELSVRSRRCMTRLGIQTLGDLVSKSEEELLSTRNFGQTSLVEIREKLRNLGLSLKGGS